jgi:hypothetical protein
MCAHRFLIREESLMIRAMTLRSLAMLLMWAGMAHGQDLPPLEGPATESEAQRADTAKTTKPVAPSSTERATASTPSAASPNRSPAAPARPTLVVPGVTTPARRAVGTLGTLSPQPRASGPQGGAPTSPAAPPPAGTAATSSPFRSPNGATAAGVRPSVPSPSLQPPIPLTIEPLDDEIERHDRPAGSRRNVDRPPGDRPSDARDARAKSGAARPAPARAPGLLGRIFGTPAPRPADTMERSDRSERSKSTAKDRQAAKSRSDPLTDAEVKEKIERQIRETLGDRLRFLEVRVNGKNVLIVAEASRFWQRRNVRRTLENLPALTGYRVKINLDD